MSKFKQLKKKLITEAGIALGVVATLGGVTLFVQSQISGFESENNRLETSILQIIQQTDDLTKKYSVATGELDLYVSVLEKLKAEKFDITENTNERIQQTLATLKQRYRIENLTFSSPYDRQESRLEDAEYNMSTAEISYRNVDMSFDALSDLHAFSFLQKIEREVPGFIGYMDFNIIRQRKLTLDALDEIAQGNTPHMVQVQVNLVWYGIDLKTTEETTTEP